MTCTKKESDWKEHTTWYVQTEGKGWKSDFFLLVNFTFYKSILLKVVYYFFIIKWIIMLLVVTTIREYSDFDRPK